MNNEQTKKKKYRVCMHWYSEVEVDASSKEEAEDLGLHHEHSAPHLEQVEVYFKTTGKEKEGKS